MTIALDPSDISPAVPAPAESEPPTAGRTDSSEEFWVQQPEPQAAEASANEPGDEPAEEPSAHGTADRSSAQEAAGEPSARETVTEPSAEEAVTDADPVVVRDARDFGVYARTGGWAFALKVARSVRPGGQPAEGTAATKVSAKAFAALAGCSPERVRRYYKAWDMAADDGVVPQFEVLVPGEDIELPDADVWLSYYTSRNSASSVRGQAISAAAEAEGIRPTKGRWRSPRTRRRCGRRSSRTRGRRRRRAARSSTG